MGSTYHNPPNGFHTNGELADYGGILTFQRQSVIRDKSPGIEDVAFYKKTIPPAYHTGKSIMKILNRESVIHREVLQ